MRQASLPPVDSNLTGKIYNGGGTQAGGLLEIKIDINGLNADELPSKYMVTAMEFIDNMGNEKSSDARIEHAVLKQLLEDLFPKLCAIVPAADTLPTVRFVPAQLRRDILMASTLREPMMSCEELCRVWDEWTITQLPATTHAAASVAEAVPSPRPEPLQSPAFSRKRVMFTIASHDNSAKRPKTNQLSTVVSSVTSIPSTTIAKGQKLRSTMRRETPQPAPFPTQSRPVPFTSPTRSSNWSWGEPRTVGNCDVGPSSARLPTSIDQNRIRYEAGLLDYNNYPPAPSLQQMTVFMNRPVGNIHHGGNAAWNIQHHEAATAFQQQYPFGSYMPPPWSASPSSFNPTVGDMRAPGMGGFVQNPQVAHPNFSAHRPISGVGMHQTGPFQPPVRHGSNARGAGPRGSPGGRRSRGGRGQRRGPSASRQHHQNTSTRADNMAGGAHRARFGGYEARGFKTTAPLRSNMRGFAEVFVPEADHIPSKAA